METNHRIEPEYPTCWTQDIKAGHLIYVYTSSLINV